MIDIRKLKELVKLMVENDLSELDLRDQEEKVTIRRGASGPEMVAPAAPVAQHAPAPATPAADGSSVAEAKPAAADDGLVAIESPMVGTFYSAANPDSDPFVSVGAEVSEGAVVCIVEAMKVFNEIKIEGMRGTVKKVLVEDGQPVEYGTVLFLIDVA